MCVEKTKALISFTAKLFCAFVFAYAEYWLSCAAAHLINGTPFLINSKNPCM